MTTTTPTTTSSFSLALTHNGTVVALEPRETVTVSGGGRSVSYTVTTTGGTHSIGSLGIDLRRVSKALTVGGQLTNGDAVVYGAAKATFKTKDVDVNVTNLSGGHVAANNNIYLPGHTFATGDAVLFTKTGAGAAIGGLLSGQTYYVIARGPNEIQLASSYFQAVGRSFDDRGTPLNLGDDIAAIAVTPIILTPSLTLGDQETTFTLVRALSGLVDGQTYYVVDNTYNTTANRTTFALAATPGGVAIEVDDSESFQIFAVGGALVRTGTAVTRGGGHTVKKATDAVARALTVRSGDDALQSLRIDLTSAGGSGEHRLLGPGGVLLASVSPPPGNGESGATAKGGSGGAVNVNVPTAELIATATVTTTVNATLLSAGRDIAVTAGSVSVVTTYADAAGGGVVEVGEAHAEAFVGQSDKTLHGLSATNGLVTTTVTLGSNVELNAADDIVLLADSDHSVSATARAPGGGVISAKIAETSAYLTYTTRTHVGEGVKLLAGDAVRVRAESSATGATDSETYSVGLGAGADSDNTNSDRGVRIDAETRVDVLAGARLEGTTVELDALALKLDGTARAYATAYSPILIGVASAFGNARVQMLSTVVVNLAGDETQITGARGLDVKAHYGSVLVRRDAWHLAVAFPVPAQNAFAEGAILLYSDVNAAPGLLVTAGARDDGRTADTGLVKTADQGLDKTNPALALYVDATVVQPTFEYPGKASSGADTHLRTFERDGRTHWKSDVTILGGIAGSPELVIDESGIIKRLRNVVVRNSNDVNAPALGVGASVGPTYYVWVANDGYGDVMFRATTSNRNTLASCTVPNGSTSRPSGCEPLVWIHQLDTGNKTVPGEPQDDTDAYFASPRDGRGLAADAALVRWPLFTFHDAFDAVTIIDHSARELHIVDIQPIYNTFDANGALANPPLVQIVTGGSSLMSFTPLQFDLWHVVTDTAWTSRRSSAQARRAAAPRTRARRPDHQPGRLDAHHQYGRRHPRRGQPAGSNERGRPRGDAR